MLWSMYADHSTIYNSINRLLPPPLPRDLVQAAGIVVVTLFLPPALPGRSLTLPLSRYNMQLNGQATVPSFSSLSLSTPVTVSLIL